MTYIDILRNTGTRQDELRKSYYFNCECARCSTPEIMEIAAVCQNKNCAIPCLPTNAYCNKCGKKFSSDFKERFDIVCELSNCKLVEVAQSVCILFQNFIYIISKYCLYIIINIFVVKYFTLSMIKSFGCM